MNRNGVFGIRRRMAVLFAVALVSVFAATTALAVNAYLNESFDTAPVLAVSDTDGAWYVDRYPPAAFENAILGGENVLRVSISANDGAALRPGGQGGAFYNTQGRKFNQFGLNVTKLEGDLYIPADWATNLRRSDLWATAYDATNTLSCYPIMGFRNVDGASPTISYWDCLLGWVNVGPPAAYDTWYHISMELNGSDLVYKLDGFEVGRVNSEGSAYYGDVILQAYNFNDASLAPTSYDPNSTYDVYWDNIKTSTNPYNATQQVYYPTIQSAIDAANPGDVINVAAGTYTENLTINKSLTLNGAQAGNPVGGRTQGSSNESTLTGEISISNASGVTVDGFTLKNPSGMRLFLLDASNGTTPVSNVTIANNFINDVGTASSCQNVHVIFLNRGPDNVTIEGNHLSNLRANRSVSAISILDTAATNSSENIVIRNNVIQDVASVTGSCGVSGSGVPNSPKGAYGVIFNNAAGSPNAQVFGNTISNLTGLWVHAIGLEGPTPDAIVRGNVISTLDDDKVPSDAVAVFFESNPVGGTAKVEFNTFGPDVPVGVAVHPKHFDTQWPNSSGTPGAGYVPINYNVNAASNYWGAPSGPSGGAATPDGCAVSGTASGSGSLVGPKVCFAQWLSSQPVVETVTNGETVNGPVANFSATFTGTDGPIVILSQFAGNPSSVSGFPGGGTFFDVFASGTGASDSLAISIPAGSSNSNLYYYDGATWKPVVALTGSPAALGYVMPNAGLYSFTLNNTNTQPLLSELSGTPFSGTVAEIRITAIPTAVSAGQTFQVVVDASSAALFGVDVSMSFDTTELDVASINLGSGLEPGTIAVNTYDNGVGAGTLRFAYSQLGASEANVSGTNLVLATITFLAHTAGDANVTLGTTLFTDRDGNPTTPAPLDSPILITVGPSPSVYVDVALQGRSDHAGLQLEVSPVGPGSVLYDNSVDTGRLEILTVPAGNYKARVSAPKYLAAVQNFSVSTQSVYDLNGVGGASPSNLTLALRGGDINGDDQINIQDLVLIGVVFGTNTSSSDINGDGVVNIQDLAIAAGNYGLKTGVIDYPDYPNDLWN